MAHVCDSETGMSIIFCQVAAGFLLSLPAQPAPSLHGIGVNTQAPVEVHVSARGDSVRHRSHSNNFFNLQHTAKAVDGGVHCTECGGLRERGAGGIGI